MVVNSKYFSSLFHWNPETLRLWQTSWDGKFWGIWGISFHFPLSMFSHIQLSFQKKKEEISLYIHIPNDCSFPSITNGVHRNENLVEFNSIPLRSTPSLILGMYVLRKRFYINLTLNNNFLFGSENGQKITLISDLWNLLFYLNAKIGKCVILIA